MTNSKLPSRVTAQHYDYSVEDIVSKIKVKDIELHPDYQRSHAWDARTHTQNKCSKLIESLLLNIPIPGIYFAEQAETLKYEVIDGQQRLTSLVILFVAIKCFLKKIEDDKISIDGNSAEIEELKKFVPKAIETINDVISIKKRLV